MVSFMDTFINQKIENKSCLSQTISQSNSVFKSCLEFFLSFINIKSFVHIRKCEKMITEKE